MKFLAFLVHAVAAASQLVFDNAPSIGENHGSVIYSNVSWAVRFRTPALLGAHDIAPGIRAISTLALDYFNFFVRTSEIPPNPLMWLQPELCPSANDLPNCTESIASSRILISNTVDGVKHKYQWTPNRPIVVTSNTTYWFTLGSSRESWDKYPTWLDGDKKFSADDPLGGVRVAYIRAKDDPWTLLTLYENYLTPSLQVHATYST